VTILNYLPVDKYYSIDEFKLKKNPQLFMSCGLVVILHISARTNTGNGHNRGCGNSDTG
jgi:hypothetical protein